jgi:hypothetical protein
MTYMQHRHINTENNYMLGTIWKFREAQVEMHKEGFSCTCRKRLTYVCNHIKSVQLGILGVGQTHYK